MHSGGASQLIIEQSLSDVNTHIETELPYSLNPFLFDMLFTHKKENILWHLNTLKLRTFFPAVSPEITVNSSITEALVFFL